MRLEIIGHVRLSLFGCDICLRRLVQKRLNNHQLRARSFGARVLYFGYSLRDELRLQCPQYWIGARVVTVASTARMTMGIETMKKFLLGTVGLVALGMAAPASAADMPYSAPYTKAPLPYVAPIYDWTGFYIGGNGGWGQSHSCVNFVDATGFAVAEGCGESVRRPRRRPARLSLAVRRVGVRPGSSGRLGGSQQPAPQPHRSFVLHSHQNRVASACSPARSVMPGTRRCFTSRAARR